MPLRPPGSSRHKAVILLTRGSRPGLFLLNALSFRTPCGPPMLQISSEESEWLKEQAAAGAEATVVAAAKRTATQAFNVTAKIAGSDPGLPPLVIMTPRSGWWQCASERGGGLACWLETMRVLAGAKPCNATACSSPAAVTNSVFSESTRISTDVPISSSAHTSGFTLAPTSAPRDRPILFMPPTTSTERWAVAAMEKEGLIVGARAGRGSVPRGEVGTLHRGGGRYVAVVCGTDVFHHAADRWPDAVDVALLARYARAFANGALQLASRII